MPSVDANMKDLLDQRSTIQQLLREARSKIDEPIPNESWVAPGDRHTSISKYPTMPDESISLMSDLYTTCMTIDKANNDNSDISREQLRRVDRKLCQLENVQQPESVPVCPTLKDFEASLTSRAVYVSFHAINGFDFSSEFENIYNGNMTLRSAYENMRAICWRALLAADSSLTDSKLGPFVDYVLRVTAWESNLAHEICDSTLQKQFPNLPASASLSNVPAKSRFVSTKVYISRSTTDDKLFLWLRVCPQIRSSLTNSDMRKLGLTSTDLANEKKLETALRCCYYRRYEISDAAVNSLNGYISATAATAGQRKGKSPKAGTEAPPPPPPPRVKDPSDMRVYVLCISSGKGDIILPPDAATAEGSATTAASTPRATPGTPRTIAAAATTNAVQLDTKRLYDVLDYDSADEHESSLSTTLLLMRDDNGSGSGGGDISGTGEGSGFYYWGEDALDASDDYSTHTGSGTAGGTDTDGDTHSVKSARSSRSNRSRGSVRSFRSRYSQYSTTMGNLNNAYAYPALAGEATAPPALDPSSTAELLGWGQNTYSSLGFVTPHSSGRSAAEADEDLLSSRAEAGGGDRDGKMRNIIHDPFNVPLPTALLFERIKMVACSSRHTLLLTTMGFVYACGENSEGALGTGDLFSRESFTLLSNLTRVVRRTNRRQLEMARSVAGEDDEDVDMDMSYADADLEADSDMDSDSVASDNEDGEEGAVGEGEDKKTSRSSRSARSVSSISGSKSVTSVGRKRGAAVHHHKIIKISAGANLLGAHSMALDSNGNLYGWGVPYAVGLGNIKPAQSPVLINPSFPTVAGRAGEEDGDSSSATDTDGEAEAAATGAGAGAEVPLTRRQLREQARQRRIDDRFVVDIACGGCFTVAVMRSGSVASWGMWSHGRLGLGPIPYINEKKVMKKSRKIAKYKLKPAYVRGVKDVVKVSCGDAHVLCTNKAGEVYVWGRNNSGQLGIGCTVSGYLIDLFSPAKVALFNQRSYSRQHQHRRPRAVDVACGSKHSLVLDDKHAVWSWGNCGHPCLGHGDSGIEGAWASRVNTIFSGAVSGKSGSDGSGGGGSGEAAGNLTGAGAVSNVKNNPGGSRIMVPYELVPWVNEWSQPRKVLSLYEIDVVSLSAGEEHSAFISSVGQLFLCGTGPVVPPFISNVLMASRNKKIKKEAGRRRPSPSSTGVAESIENDAGGSGGGAAAAAGGAAAAPAGGGGAAAAAGEPEGDYDEDEDMDDFDVEGTGDDDGREEEGLGSAEGVLKHKYGDDRFNVVSLPRCPSSSWLSSICTRRFVHIAGGGYKCFAIQDEEFIVPSLMQPLMGLAAGRANTAAAGAAAAKAAASKREAHHHHHHDHDTDASDGNVSDSDSVSVASSHGSSVYSNSSSVLEARGRVDCMLISSGKVNMVHRAFLAQRSNAIRDMILSETPTEEEEWLNTPTQLLMPELHRETAQALVHFLYTDTLPKDALSNISLLYSLSHAAANLRLNRLKILCDNLLSTLSIVMLSNKREAMADRDEREAEEAERNMQTKEGFSGTRFNDMDAATVADDLGRLATDMPPTTLARDLGSLIGDPQFADVRFIIEGKSIAAHRFILEHRSEYFKLMFRSNMAESGGDGGIQRVCDVVVPGSFVGFLRLLLYMYTSTLPDGSDAALLEDLETAHRYCIPSMKILCENMLHPTKSNWRDLLNVATMLDLQRMKLEVLIFLRDNFDILISFDHDIFIRLNEEFPGLLNTILAMRCKTFPSPPSYKFIEHIKETKLNEEKKNADEIGIPWVALLVMIAASYLYQHAIRIVSIGPLVPIVNVAFTVCLLYYAYQMVSKQWKMHGA